MSRPSSPWFWVERAEWCVNFGGKRHKLGSHPNDFPQPKKVKGKWNPPPAIWQKFHELMASRGNDESPTPVAATDSPLVVTILDKYLDWCRKERSARTYDWYLQHIKEFLKSLGVGARSLTVAGLKPFHVIE